MIGRGNTDVAATQALWEFSAKELAAMRRRADTRAFNRSLEGVQKKLEDKARAMVEKYGDFEQAPPEVQDSLLATWSELLDLASAREIAKRDRQDGLRQRADSLEKALANQEDPAYRGALSSLMALQDSREATIRGVFGDKHDEAFAKRVDLLADWLAEQGLLPADFARGTGKYFRHSAIGEGRTRKLDRPAAALTSQVIGLPDQSILNLYNRNNLIRWQNGDLNADPKVVFESWHNAQAFAFVKTLRDKLMKVGRQLNADDPIPDDAMVIVDGTPLPWLQRATMKPGSTADIQRVNNALEGRDPAALEESLTEYANSIMVDGKKLREIIAQEDNPVAARREIQAWIVDKNHVEQLFRPLQGSWGGRVGRTWDLGNTIARWSLIYTNPMYVPINFVANNFFLLAQQGPMAISRLVMAARVMNSNPDLSLRIGAQVGELPAIAAISRGRRSPGSRIGTIQQRAAEITTGALERLPGVPERSPILPGRSPGAWAREAEFTGYEQATLRTYTGLADKMPRVAAWIYEAQKKGYHTAEDMNRLLDGKTEKTRADREIVADRSNEIMVNFDRLSDWERAYFTKVLFIWPWIRGATAWPFYYAREFPVAAGVGANIGYTTEQYRKKKMGNVPSYARDLFPLGTKDGRARVINLRALSPTSTAAESYETITEFLESVVGDKPMEAPFAERLQPILAAAVEGLTGRDKFGRDIGWRSAFTNNLWRFAPQGTTLQQIIHPDRVSKTYPDDSALGVFQRRYTPYLPYDVSLQRLHAFQQQSGQKTTLEKANEKIADIQQGIKDAGFKNAPPVPESVRAAVVTQQAYWDALDKKKQETGEKLSNLERAQVVYSIYQEYAPDALPGLIRPDQASPGLLEVYDDWLMYGNAEEGIDGILAPLVEYQQEVSAAKREASG
jgi:hypothetical protein